jgi:predicted nucleic acid-binding protein
LVILADTSAWIEYEHATGSPVDQRLTRLIEKELDVLAVTEPVIMEVVAGARTDAREAELRNMLLGCQLLNFDSGVDFDRAAMIYRRCRVRGVTPRGIVDCMIAAVAWRNGAALLANDADLYRVAQVVGLDVDPASLAV